MPNPGIACCRCCWADSIDAKRFGFNMQSKNSVKILKPLKDWFVLATFSCWTPAPGHQKHYILLNVRPGQFNYTTQLWYSKIFINVKQILKTCRPIFFSKLIIFIKCDHFMKFWITFFNTNIFSENTINFGKENTIWNIFFFQKWELLLKSEQKI